MNNYVPLAPATRAQATQLIQNLAANVTPEVQQALALEVLSAATTPAGLADFQAASELVPQMRFPFDEPDNFLMGLLRCPTGNRLTFAQDFLNLNRPVAEPLRSPVAATPARTPGSLRRTPRRQRTSTYASLSGEQTPQQDYDTRVSQLRRRIAAFASSFGEHSVVRVPVDRSTMQVPESLQVAAAWPRHFDVKFSGEAGIDAGGLTKDWLDAMLHKTFAPENGLFDGLESDTTKLGFHTNVAGEISEAQQNDLRLAGRLLGKALQLKQATGIEIAPLLLDNLAGRTPNTLEALKRFDADTARALEWYLSASPEELQAMDQSFTYPEPNGTDHVLMRNGEETIVDTQNRKLYVDLVAKHLLQGPYHQATEAFSAGLHDLVPSVSAFSSDELQTLIAGHIDIDVADWKNFTAYNTELISGPEHGEFGIDGASLPVVAHFWNFVEGLTPAGRRHLFWLATGTSAVQSEGTVDLGFTINITDQLNALPKSHTCFNILEIPNYPSKEILESKMQTFLTEGDGTFGIE